MSARRKGNALHSGVTTNRVLDRDLPGFLVTWIDWKSGFRNSGLRPGDLMVEVDGRPVAVEPEHVAAREMGAYQESAGWEAAGAGDGTRVTVTVVRGAERLLFTGTVRAERFHQTPAGRPETTPGPPRRSSGDASRREAASRRPPPPPSLYSPPGLPSFPGAPLLPEPAGGGSAPRINHPPCPPGP